MPRDPSSLRREVRASATLNSMCISEVDGSKNHSCLGVEVSDPSDILEYVGTLLGKHLKN